MPECEAVSALARRDHAEGGVMSVTPRPRKNRRRGRTFDAWWKRRWGKPFDTWWARFEKRVTEQRGMGVGRQGMDAYQSSRRHKQVIQKGGKP